RAMTAIFTWGSFMLAEARLPWSCAVSNLSSGRAGRLMMVAALEWLAGRILRLIPEELLGRLLPSRYRFSAADIPPPPQPPDTTARLLIAPVNYAGQGWQWARAVERNVETAGATNLV